MASPTTAPFLHNDMDTFDSTVKALETESPFPSTLLNLDPHDPDMWPIPLDFVPNLMSETGAAEIPPRNAAIFSHASSMINASESSSGRSESSVVDLSPFAEEALTWDDRNLPPDLDLHSFVDDLPPPRMEEDWADAEAQAAIDDEDDDLDALGPSSYDSDPASHTSPWYEHDSSSPTVGEDLDDDELGDMRVPRAEKKELARRPFAKRSKPDFYQDMTAEERCLIEREGFVFPNRALTKSEEKELKKVRRKVKNKISAQDSRKRRKEYVSVLEGKVKLAVSANQGLKSRVTSLVKENHTLMEKLQELQRMLASYAGKGHPSTGAALMILGLCFSLFVSPDALGGSVSGLQRMGTDGALPEGTGAEWTTFQSRTLKALPEGSAASASASWTSDGATMGVAHGKPGRSRGHLRRAAGAADGADEYALPPSDEQQLMELFALLQTPHDAASTKQENATTSDGRAEDMDMAESAAENDWDSSAALPTVTLVSATA